MNLFWLTLKRVNVLSTFRELGTDRQRRETMIALASTQMLVQLSSMPVAMTIPSVARHFDVEVSQAAWMIIIRLLMLGSTVFLAARLGEKFGHVRVFLLGAVVMCLGSVLSAAATSLNQLIFWSGVVGVGGAMITANSNALLAIVFNADERGRAFSVPVVSARIGTLIGLVLFGVFLQFFSWRLVFLTSLPIGLLALKTSYPLLKYQAQQFTQDVRNISINYIGAALMVVTLGTFVLSGLHIHGGPEAFNTSDALRYHIPMHLLFLALLGLFILVQSRSSEPFVDFRYFKKKYFSTALYSNTTFHFSMLAVTTLVPIMVENGLGKPPIFVTLVLMPNQLLGLFLPTLAGWVYDRYNPRWLRPGALASIALGFLLVGIFSTQVAVWGIPLLMLPTYIGANLFNTANNALVMNTLPENRSFASGMLETTRQMGHTLGATVGATVLGLALPAAIAFLPLGESQSLYREGFRFAALAVVLTMLSGSLVAIFQKMPQTMARRRITEAVPQASGGDG
jgi:MFS family permease